jgi:hypothetical protein
MNKTFIYSLIGAIVVCFGFGLFYLLKILPVQQSIAYSQSNIQMYRQTVAANQKAVLQGKKDLEARKKQIQKEEALGQKVSRSILPSSPDIEKFLTVIQEEAGDLGVTVASISKAQGSGTANAQSSASSNKTTSGNTSRTKSLSSLLTANTYTIMLNADRELPVLTYLGYLEAQKRLLTIDNLNLQQNMDSGSSQTSSSAASSSGLSQASSGSTANSSGSSASSTSSSNGSSATDSAVTSGSSVQGSSAAAVPAQPKYTATLTLTLYSAKN